MYVACRTRPFHHRKILATVLLLVAGCSSTIYRYGAVGADPATVAVVRGPYGVSIESIDGDSNLERPGCTGFACSAGFEIYLRPGKHTILARLATGIYSTRAPMPVEVEVRAGRTYLFVSEVATSNCRFSGDPAWFPTIVEAAPGQTPRETIVLTHGQCAERHPEAAARG